jgi:hypothetical protein
MEVYQMLSTRLSKEFPLPSFKIQQMGIFTKTKSGKD